MGWLDRSVLRLFFVLAGLTAQFGPLISIQAFLVMYQAMCFTITYFIYCLNARESDMWLCRVFWSPLSAFDID